MWYLLGLLLWTLVSVCQTHVLVAPYQVSIQCSAPAIVGSYLANDGIGPSEHICNGVIIREKYILTTAGCLFVRDKLTNLRRLINAAEIFILAGDLNLSQVSTGNNSGIRRNVVSVIPHNRYNSSTGENDIALLKLDRSLPLYNTTSVQWIELQQSALPPTIMPMAAHQTTAATAIAASNKVNENCFINIYNNSVGVSNYPYATVANVSMIEKWICDSHWKSPSGTQSMVGRAGTCVEYRFSNSKSCWLDSQDLRYSGERGTALVCNFKLVAILAEINPPVNPQSCTQMKRTTAFYTPVAPYRDWIVGEIGSLYTTSTSATGANKTVTGGGGNVASSGGTQQPNANGPPSNSWSNQQATTAAANPGKSNSVAVSIGPGIASNLILLNLFITFTFIYRF
ncbi:acrosin-like [Topomyia yanbarensis]|uniref:acrosin-like n=1 Tax=Topomyia yanbarensis TaxID=2498891 RepID=UPI00273B4C7B|nr:acrosin-like [Topomyia yanbarensis]XP_058819539.1 acrosin-like [Topomyia yanbarensis]